MNLEKYAFSGVFFRRFSARICLLVQKKCKLWGRPCFHNRKKNVAPLFLGVRFRTRGCCPFMEGAFDLKELYPFKPNQQILEILISFANPLPIFFLILSHIESFVTCSSIAETRHREKIVPPVTAITVLSQACYFL